MVSACFCCPKISDVAGLSWKTSTVFLTASEWYLLYFKLLGHVTFGSVSLPVLSPPANSFKNDLTISLDHFLICLSNIPDRAGRTTNHKTVWKSATSCRRSLVSTLLATLLCPKYYLNISCPLAFFCWFLWRKSTLWSGNENSLHWGWRWNEKLKSSRCTNAVLHRGAVTSVILTPSCS